MCAASLFTHPLAFRIQEGDAVTAAPQEGTANGAAAEASGGAESLGVGEADRLLDLLYFSQVHRLIVKALCDLAHAECNAVVKLDDSMKQEAAAALCDLCYSMSKLSMETLPQDTPLHILPSASAFHRPKPCRRLSNPHTTLGPAKVPAFLPDLVVAVLSPGTGTASKHSHQVRNCYQALCTILQGIKAAPCMHVHANIAHAAVGAALWLPGRQRRLGPESGARLLHLLRRQRRRCATSSHPPAPPGAPSLSPRRCYECRYIGFVWLQQMLPSLCKPGAGNTVCCAFGHCFGACGCRGGWNPVFLQKPACAHVVCDSTII